MIFLLRTLRAYEGSMMTSRLAWSTTREKRVERVCDGLPLLVRGERYISKSIGSTNMAPHDGMPSQREDSGLFSRSEHSQNMARFASSSSRPCSFLRFHLG